MTKIKTVKLLFLGALCVLCVNLVSRAGQEAPLAFEALSEDLIERAVELGQQALAESRAYEFLAALTSEVGPRFAAGSTNDRRAVEWAQRKLEELGFSNVHTEEVIVPCWKRGSAAGAISSSPEREIDLVALGGSVATPVDGIEAEVILVADLEDLAKLDRSQVAGRIVFFNRAMERARDGSGYGRAAPIRRSGPARAGELGAVAVIIRPVATSSDFPHTGTTFYEEGAPLIPAAALSNRGADLLADRIRSGETVRFRLALGCRFLPDKKSANVIGEIPGREHPDEVVLLAAHLDSWDLATGALDDGTGCAIITETARLIGALEPAPRRTIRVFFAANEEYGVSGGVAYARKHEAEAKLHVAAMEADFGAGRAVELRAHVAPEIQPVVDELARLLAPLGIGYLGTGTLGGTDILPMMGHRIPLFELPQDATHYFDSYHSAHDTLDKVDADDLAQVVAAFSVTALVAADHESGLGRAPRFWGRLPAPFDQIARGQEWISPARSKNWVEPFKYAESEVFPIEIGDFGFPYVPVVIDGTSMKLPFDTGNMVGLSVSSTRFDRLRLETEGDYKPRTADGRVGAPLRIATASKVAFLGRSLGPTRIFEFDHPSLPGLIGPGFVGDGHFTLDYTSRRIAVSDTGLPEKIPGFRPLPLLRSSRHPALILVRGTIGERDVLIEVDTGKSRTVINPTLAKELSLERNSRGVAIENLRIGDLRFSVPSAKEVDQSAIDRDLPEPILAGVGSDLLSRFTWTVDYDRSVLWIPDSR